MHRVVTIRSGLHVIAMGRNEKGDLVLATAFTHGAARRKLLRENKNVVV